MRTKNLEYCSVIIDEVVLFLSLYAKLTPLKSRGVGAWVGKTGLARAAPLFFCSSLVTSYFARYPFQVPGTIFHDPHHGSG
jgi:hypothetical protein